jgi:hypothetical protein
MIKLLLDEKNEPVLFLERIYPTETPSIKSAFIKAARKKAKAMGVKLYEDRGRTPLHSNSCAAPFEYEDAGRAGVTRGKYTILAKKIAD